jgi:nucleoside-diphosphate-sugar epimerase
MSIAPTLMIAGCGDVGSRLGQQLHAAGWQVYGLRRSVAALPQGILPVAGDLTATDCPAQWPEGPLDYLVYAAAATEHDEAGYRRAYYDGLANTLSWLKQRGQAPKRVIFVSSSGVYAQDGGVWVDEQSPAEATRFSGRILLEAERLALDSGLPATIVRLTGIYGPGREWLLKQVRMGYRVVSEPPLYANRLHADDCAGLLAFLLQADAAGKALDELYIGVDDAPAPLDEVVDWLRERLGITRWSDSQSVRRTGSKRCSNARARALGWAPQYPSYREGYGQLLAQ